MNFRIQDPGYKIQDAGFSLRVSYLPSHKPGDKLNGKTSFDFLRYIQY